MLAVKLHKSRRPWLGNGSHLVPIARWDCGKLQVRNWIGLLTASQRSRYPNAAIRSITLVRVPVDHPVELSSDWASPWPKVYLPLRDADPDVKRALSGWTAAIKVPGYPTQPARLRCPVPQIILEAPLPRRCVRWTKDVRRLYYGDRRQATVAEVAE